jgi:alcohol dehydrogenase class IV
MTPTPQAPTETKRRETVLTQPITASEPGPTMRTLTFYQPQRLVFGCGCLAQCIAYLKESGHARLRILTSSPLAATASRIQSELAQAGASVSIDADLPSEPTIADFEAVTARAREAGANCILGLGGGSVLDLAKLVAAFIRGDQRVEETFGIGLLHARACQLVCVPTTSGTGSEVSPNAILLDEAAKLKKAVISPHLLPDAVFVDPDLTLTVPAAVTAATGLDALAHCIEAYTNKFAHPLVDLYALEGIALCGRFLLRAVQRPGDRKAREGMSLASLYGGLCLGPVNTAAGHALAYPLGSEYHIAHGVSVALVQPHVFRFNAEAAPERHANVARTLGVPECSTALETARAGAVALERLTTNCGLDRDLGHYGVEPENIPALARSAMTVQRLLRNNPRPVAEEDCISIYRTCFGRDLPE